MDSPPGQDPSSARRCRPRRLDPAAPRPSDMLWTFFLAALVMLAAAGVAAIAHLVTGDPELHWLALHLALLGGVSQLILGAGQFFVCAFLATTPPSSRLVAAQLAAWNAGTLLVVVGVTTARTVPVDIGGVLVAGGLALFAGSLLAMQRRSLQQARWAVRWYLGSAACLGIGVLLGVGLARGVGWPHGSLLGAHLALNLAGWLGTAIVGTLHTFFPSLTGTRLRFGALQGPTFLLWLIGTVELALGAAFSSDIAVVFAWLELAVAAGLLTVNLVASLLAASIALSLPARLIAAAQVFLPVALVVAFVATVADGAGAPFAGAARNSLATLLLAGWIGMTVSGALLHLLAVLARIRRFTVAMPTPRPLRDRALVAFASFAVALHALAQAPGWAALRPPATVLLVAAATVVAAQVLILVHRAGRGRLSQAPIRGVRAPM